ncbi:MAG: MarR family transcriptional regulator [bacterium]|nr:MAG: MarR family transcriptional regulator [bacterium]
MPSKRKKSDVPVRDAELDMDARDLYRAVSELVRIYQFRDRKSICYYDISVTQCYALSAIIANESMTLNRLAAVLYLDKSTASRSVETLVRKGYARRSTDPTDARALNLEVTKKGRDLHSKIIEDLIEEMKKLVADYDPGTRQATTRLIARLANAATARFGQKGEKCTGEV